MLRRRRKGEASTETWITANLSYYTIFWHNMLVYIRIFSLSCLTSIDRSASRLTAMAGEWGESDGEDMATQDNTSRMKIDGAFREESDLLLRWLESRLGNLHDAEDVMQSCYARVLAFAEKNDIDNAKALIFRTAANLAIDEMRRRKRALKITLPHDTDDERDIVENIQCTAPDSEKALLTREDIKAAIVALDQLAPNVKRSFLLSRVYGKTYSEIAGVLGVSVSAVEKYMIKAVSFLKVYKIKQEQLAGVKSTDAGPTANQLRRIAKYRALLSEAEHK